MRKGADAMTLEQNAAAGRRRKPRVRVKHIEALYRQGELPKARDLTRTLVLETPLEPEQATKLLRVTSHVDPIDDGDVLLKLKHDLSRQNLSEEDRHSLLPILRLGETRPDPDRRYLFVSGVARSGTTALGRLVNLSGDVALFVERFAPHYGYHPLMFTPEHVFGDVRKNRRHGNSWADARQKFGTAAFVGDKRPGFLQGWNVGRRNFLPGQIKVLHVVRDIRGIAWSYNKRIEAAQSGEGAKWSESRDHERAVADFNLTNRILLAAVSEDRRRDDVVVDYDRIFRSAPLVEEAFRRIGIPMTDALRRDVERFVARSEPILERERRLSSEEEAYIEEHVDWDAARAAKALCL
jgi:hypothetical protein